MCSCNLANFYGCAELMDIIVNNWDLRLAKDTKQTLKVLGVLENQFQKFRVKSM